MPGWCLTIKSSLSSKTRSLSRRFSGLLSGVEYSDGTESIFFLFFGDLGYLNYLFFFQFVLENDRPSKESEGLDDRKLRGIKRNLENSE